MKRFAWLVLVFGFAVLTNSKGVTQEKVEKRFGLSFEPDLYPQATPKELVGSVLKALKRERFDYFVAHLMEPTFVDARLKATGITFEQLANEIKGKFQAQPELYKDLLKVLAEGEVADTGDRAEIKHKEVKNQKVFLKKSRDRWFIENRMKDEKEKE